MMTRFFLIFSMIATLFAATANADNAKGEEAYANGDYALALKEFSAAAEKGDMNAQYNLGVMYEHGNGVEQSDKKAAEWYQKAADNGHPEAPMALQLLYEYF
ncbi:MAG: sel1 repeat family protein [Alphaproteobacteria bacterium]|nr:sel1 repeat family protein [Alphaproteobacteria bacterium]HPF46303.1 tetratricopeptide repeat protein [Emcibacteraceae bacterium]HRW29794.1 tetratricopeptide repeat protein [Emcibacteraceae bacterium]